MGRARLVVAALACAAALGHTPAHAQLTRRLLPPKAFLPTLVAAPREPMTAAKLMVVTRNATQLDETWEGEAALGTPIPLYVLSGDTPEHSLVLGVQGGVFARFSLSTESRDLISSDWVFALPLVLRRGGHWVRVRYFHQSSHLGDEYSEAFDVDRIPYGRDEVELLGHVSLSEHVGIYGGGRFGFRVEPQGTGRWTARFGTQLDGPSGARVQLYGGADIEFAEPASWDPRLNVQFGLRLNTFGEHDVRLAGEFLTGPSVQGQFLGERETLVSLGLYFDL